MVRKVKEPQKSLAAQGRSNTLTIRIDDLDTFKALTDSQQAFFDAWQDGSYFNILLGYAGTGKSFIAIYKALEQVLDYGNPYNKLVIVRSAVQSREIGYTPGTLEEKMSLYEQPYMQICDDLFTKKDSYKRLKEQHHIEFISTSFVRGTTFNNSIIVVDEVQNMTWEELSTIVTRVGYDSKIIFCGDYRQSDLNKRLNDKSGLAKFHSIAKTLPNVTEIEFTEDDIVRSKLVKDFIIATTKYEDSN